MAPQSAMPPWILSILQLAQPSRLREGSPKRDNSRMLARFCSIRAPRSTTSPPAATFRPLARQLSMEPSESAVRPCNSKAGFFRAPAPSLVGSIMLEELLSQETAEPRERCSQGLTNRDRVLHST